ncbi:hypothetical protein CE143_20960 [Photorhabdus luminescens]|uniref:Uncharacterized protein n=2 Tax=Morganellaceae TaxID=1903414 RepID=A0ABX8M2F6_9GAMM|nr:hypothetical protein B0X70_20915 [Photorhabdus akhurstii]UJD77206.1 hypothetical protein CE143_20960 [Photorhabdus luminescens]
MEVFNKEITMPSKDYGLVDKVFNENFKGMHVETITVKIAPSGTKYTNSAGDVSKSTFGHVWVEFQGESIGWGLGDNKQVGGVENITFRDSIAYDKSKISSVTYPIYSESVVHNMRNYISDLKNGNFYDFKPNYNLLTNNCIDFVNSILRVSHYDNDKHGIDFIQELRGMSPNAVLDNLEEIVEDQKSTETPLIIDLTGDGIITIAENGSIYFDHDNDGIVESSGWIEANNAFLVWDKNGDGKINNGNELFGNNSILKNGIKSANGFAALADLDDNFDGIFNQNDSLWNSLELWIDANKDGITDNGELYKLSESGISAINLTYKENGFKDINGNIHGLESSVLWNNGDTTKIVDVFFAVDKNIQMASLNSNIDIIGINNTFSEIIL